MSDAADQQTPTKAQLQIARCCFLDSFAAAEQAVIGLQHRYGQKTCNASLGHRLETLLELKASPTLPKTKLALIRANVERLDVLNTLRNDIVHSRMGVAPILGEIRACFVNTRVCIEEFASARLITLDQFARLGKELAGIATALDQI